MPPSFNAFRHLVVALAIASTAACHREQAPVQSQRIALDQVPSQGEQPLSSPDTEGARWMPSADGQAIDFGRPGQRPFLTLACHVRSEPPQVTIIRHAPARPGEKALFPVMSNTTISRFKVDAALRDNEWRWEATLPADDPQLEVFEESRALEATLPGGGTLKIAASGVPGEFVGWCRKRGQAPAIADDKNDEAAKPAD
jgi:hypothetical protein